MFSGKSTELIRRVRKYQAAKRRTIVIKFAGDLRYDNVDSVATHDHAFLPAVQTKCLADIAHLITDEIHVVAIDEG